MTSCPTLNPDTQRRMREISGCPAIGTAAFARTEESGRSLVPEPAVRMSAARGS